MATPASRRSTRPQTPTAATATWSVSFRPSVTHRPKSLTLPETSRLLQPLPLAWDGLRLSPPHTSKPRVMLQHSWKRFSTLPCQARRNATSSARTHSSLQLLRRARRRQPQRHQHRAATKSAPRLLCTTRDHPLAAAAMEMTARSAATTCVRITTTIPTSWR